MNKELGEYSWPSGAGRIDVKVQEEVEMGRISIRYCAF